MKVLNRTLIEAGLITMKDSPNGKCDPKSNIVEAHAFDLSPIAARHAAFVRLAREARGRHVRDECQRPRMVGELVALGARLMVDAETTVDRSL